MDMISTGTDIKPLECLLFMRDIKSRVYFEQMKGRGTRVISPTDLNAVTPDVSGKSHFVIVDAIGVCESDKTDSRPLEKKRSVPFDRLITSVALGSRDEDTLTSLAGRLARLEREIDEKDMEEIKTASNGKPLREMVNRLLDAVDPDKKIEKAMEIFKTPEPTEEEVKKAAEALVHSACAPFDNPKLRNTLIEVRQRSEQVIDTVSKDALIFSGFDAQAKDKARAIVDNFRKFIEKNKSELTALQIFYSQPYGRRHMTFNAIKELAGAIEKPPYNLTTELLWKAYEQLERSKVKRAGPQKLLTDIISLVSFAIGESEVLEPFTEVEDRRFNKWLSDQEKAGRRFTPEQLAWLEMIKNHIAASLSIAVDDFQDTPFYEKGGALKFYNIFGKESERILKELYEALAA